MEVKYCSQCSDSLVQKEIGDEGFVPYCQKCNKAYFSHPMPCILALVINEHNEIVLLKQGDVSTSNHVLIAGYIQSKETAEECMIREVYEEVGLKVYDYQLLQTKIHTGKDLLMIGFVAKVLNEEFRMSKEVEEALWVPLDEASMYLRENSIGSQFLNEYFQSESKFIGV